MAPTTLKRRSVVGSTARLENLSTLVLDVNLTVIRHVPWQRAVTMMVHGSVNMLASYTTDDDGVMRELMVRSPSRSHPLPFIVSLVQYVHDPYADFLTARNAKASTRAILARDNHRCGYCGDRATTRDHIQPRSRGGLDSWENLIAACVACNNVKADRTPDEAGMPLLFEPSTYDGFDSSLQEQVWQFLMEQSGAVPSDALDGPGGDAEKAA